MTSSCSSGMMRGRLVRLLRLTALLTVVGIIASYKTAPRPHREDGPQHDPIFVTHQSNTARKSFARPRKELHSYYNQWAENFTKLSYWALPSPSLLYYCEM